MSQSLSTAASTVQVVSSLNPANVGELVELVATVNSTTGLAAPGEVTFTQNGTPLGPPVRVSGGRAVFLTNTLPMGSNTIDVSYTDVGAFAPSTTQYIQQIN